MHWRLLRIGCSSAGFRVRSRGGGPLTWVELRGFEPLTPCMPSMRERFASPCNASRVHITAQVRSAVEDQGVVRREVVCSAVSGKSLATPLPVVVKAASA